MSFRHPEGGVLLAYKIESITNLDGTPRTDGRYPQRVGCIAALPYPVFPGIGLYINYLRDNAGKQKDGWLQTSTVIDVDRLEDGGLVVTTLNSIYTFSVVDKLP